MTPRERTIAALEGRTPDVVPHFELEFQLGEEYFGRTFITKAQWEAEPRKAGVFLRHDAEHFVEVAEAFDYGAILYSHVYRPSREYALEGIRVLRELDGGRRLLLAHGDSTMSIPDGEHMVDNALELFEHPADVKAREDRRVDETLERVRRSPWPPASTALPSAPTTASTPAPSSRPRCSPSS